jgi:large subunit ribosomal protein LP2
MRVIAAYLMAVLGGNDSPSADDVKKILESVGIEADGDQVDKVISELSGKDIDELITQGTEKLAAVPTGGGAAAGGAAASGDAADAAEAEPEEESESESESDADMGFSLFDD